VLTYVEVATATLEPGLEDVDLEGLHDAFGVCEIELIEEIDRATAASLIIERAPDRRTGRNAPLRLEAEATTSGLQLFLKEIGKVGC
jgi:hypothetical protein